MSIQSLIEKKNNLILFYNAEYGSKTATLKGDHSSWNDYAESSQNKFLDEQTKKIQNEYLGKLKSFKGELLTEQTKLTNTIKTFKYPSLASKDPASRTFGESQINSSYTFLGSSKKKEEILNAINSAIDLNRLDFSYQVISNLVPEELLELDYDSQSMKNKILELTPTDKDDSKRELWKEILNIYSTKWPNVDKLSLSQKEIKEIESLKKGADSLIEQVQSGSERIGHYTRQEIESMGSQEMQENIDVVNLSVASFSK